MLQPGVKRASLQIEISRGREAFLTSFETDQQFARYLNVPRHVMRSVQSGLHYGYRRAGDEEIIKTLAAHHLKLGRPLRCLEIGAGVTAQWSEISGHRGSPWLSRYLALHHADKFEVIASDAGCSDKGHYLSLSVIRWAPNAEAWDIRPESFTLWQSDTAPALYRKIKELFASDLGCGVALPASALGLKAAHFRPTPQAGFPRFSEAHFADNLIFMPEISPALESSMFKLRFEEGVDILSPPQALGQFDVIFGRHLGIPKDTLLNSIPRLSGLLRPQGKIFMYTDYSPFTVLITLENGRLQHNFPD